MLRLSRAQSLSATAYRARAGSKRVVDKNIRELAGHPMLAHYSALAKHAKLVVDTRNACRRAGVTSANVVPA